MCTQESGGLDILGHLVGRLVSSEQRTPSWQLRQAAIHLHSSVSPPGDL